MSITHLNLNNQVKVKLTEAGKKYLKQKKLKLAADEDGCLTLPLWEFAGIFGDALQSATLNPPVEPNIVLIADKQSVSKHPQEQPVKIGSIAICALRYAIATVAQQQVKDDCINGIKSYWGIISIKERSVITRNLKEAIDSKKIVESFSIWHEFHKWICNFQQQDAMTGEIQYLGKLSLFAIRYCIGKRVTYMPNLIIIATKDNWQLLSENDRVAIKDEVRLACEQRNWATFNWWISRKI